MLVMYVHVHLESSVVSCSSYTLNFNGLRRLPCWCGIIGVIVPFHIWDNASDPSSWRISLPKLDYLLMIVPCIYVHF